MNKQELKELLKELNSCISYNRLEKYDVSDSGREVYDVDHVVKCVLLARDAIKKIVEE